MLTAIYSVRARECLDTPHKIKRCVSASITTCFLFPFSRSRSITFFFFAPHHQPFYIHFLIRIKVLEEEHRFVWDADDINTPGGMTDEQHQATKVHYGLRNCMRRTPTTPSLGVPFHLLLINTPLSIIYALADIDVRNFDYVILVITCKPLKPNALKGCYVSGVPEMLCRCSCDDCDHQDLAHLYGM